MQNKRILVIDDDREILKAYQAVLAPEKKDTDSSEKKIAGLLYPDEDFKSLVPQFQLSFASQGDEGFRLIEKSLSENMPFAIAFIDITEASFCYHVCCCSLHHVHR